MGVVVLPSRYFLADRPVGSFPFGFVLLASDTVKRETVA